MPEHFDEQTWRSRIAAWWRETAQDVPGKMKQLGVGTAYGLLTASAWLSLLTAYGDNPGAAVTALVGVLNGVGTNLLSNLVQGAYDKTTAPKDAEQEVAEQPGLRAEYQQMLQRLGVVAAAQEALGSQWAEFETQLRGELARMGGGLRIETEGGAVVFGDVIVPHGDFVGRDKKVIIHIGTPSPDATPRREAYLRHCADRCGRLPLRGVDVQAGDPTAGAERPRLAHVYIHLDTTAPAVKEERKGRQRLPLEVLTERDGLPSEGRRLSALEAVIGNRRLVLLGAPGSGKSTFVGHLTWCLAMAQLEPEGDWLDRLPGWPADEADALPVVVTLRDFARWATAKKLEQGTAQALADFIAARLQEHDLADFVPPLREALHRGEAIVLLDGLDEVPTREQRGLVRDAVEGFARTYDQSRLLVTCRTLSYQDPAWQLDGERFSACELAPFDEEKINRFIGAWYRELADLGAVRPEDVEPLAEKLRGAVRRPDLWRLAPNPLLLTVMALVHAHKGRLPEARALLYEECTDLLLWRWEQVKVQAEREQVPGLRQLLIQAGLQDVDLKQTLWALAFEAHQATGGDDEEATADIAETRLLQTLRELHPDRSWDWAAEVVQRVRERAGLLVERDVGIYAFPHRTFQEYLAGCHLSVQAGFAEQAAILLVEAAFWRQAVLLAVGRQVHVSGEMARPLALVAELCPAGDPRDERGWRNVWLAGEVLLEAGVERASRSGLGQELLARVRERLTALLEGGHLAARERAEAGDVLGRLGDPRFAAEVHFLPIRYRGEPEPLQGFVEIPPGPFVMGSRKEDKGAGSDEFGNPEHLTIPYRYWMARYPVTVAQYGCFVEAGGYEEPRWWTETGWAWRQGAWDSQVEEKWLRDWLSGRPAEQRDRPVRWSAQLSYPTRPVVRVCWFEAVAYCNWLTEKMQEARCKRQDAKGRGQEAGSKLQVWRHGELETLHLEPGTFVVRLPTEAEWEKAARSGDGRRYPWGNEDWEPQRANVEGSIGDPSPVGMYPLGATPSGVHDMAGNVWEWTATLYRPYPYHPDDGRNDPAAAEEDRVVRGGSWRDLLRDARCAFRDGGIPDYFGGDVGFRVVVSLAGSGS